MRPSALGLPNLAEGYESLGNGDYLHSVGEEVDLFLDNTVNDDTITMVWVGLEYGVDEASVWTEVIEDWSEPRVGKTNQENYLTIEFGGGEDSGFLWTLVNIKAGVLTIIKNKTTLLGRVFFGTSAQLPALKALTVPLWAYGADENSGYLTLDEQNTNAFIVGEVQRSTTYRVVGFNLPLNGPKVKGGQASSGILCEAVGGDYGVEFQTPDMQFYSLMVFDAEWLWLALAPET